MTIRGLVNVENISSKQIGVRRSPYLLATVKPTRKEELEAEGWEFVPSKLKKTIRMRMPKVHYVAFEDRVWALLAKMRFAYLNESNQFELEYKPSMTKKIDVFAADEECVLIVECKSSAIRRSVSYQKDINELISMKEGLRRAVQNLLERKAKVAFIFATNNAILSDNDRQRLHNDSIFHFTEDDIEYFEQLTDQLGPAAKYQFFGKVFSGQKIAGLKNRVPAIKGKISSGHTCYSFSIEPEMLLKIGFVLHRTETNAASSQAYQRLINRSKIREIGKYIDDGGYFPNSVIANIETKREKDLQFDLASPIAHDSSTSLGVLHLPQVYRSVFIIDGQHRLYGYSRTKSKSHHTIPVVAFHNLPQREQAKIFVDINHKQKPVPANLLRSLMADFHWNSDDARLALAALKTRILHDMNADYSSPLYKRIVMAEERRTDTRCLTLETMLKWGLSSNLGFFGKAKGKRLVKTGYLTDVSYEATLTKSLSFFNACFRHIEDGLPEQWKVGSGEGGFISMNIGVSAIMRTLDRIMDYLTRCKNLKPEDLTGEQLAETVKPYLDAVVNFTKGLDAENRNRLRKLFGSGATEKVLMEFLNSIHEDCNEFNPEGLEQWIKEHSGVYIQPSWNLGRNQIEPMIHEFITSQLKREYGERSWWTEGVPKDIQKVCSEARIDAGTDEPDWNFLNTIHYHSIIIKNWPLLGTFFTPPGLDNAKREKKLSWLTRLNLIRQRYSHPQRPIITEDEYLFLKELFDWLTVSLKQPQTAIHT
jgi:DNA sulfur modification protein DndB